MGMPLFRSGLAITLALGLVLPLAACDSLFTPKPKPVHHVQAVAKPTTADAYLAHLALARLELPVAVEDTQAADADLDIVQAYHAAPKTKAGKKAKAQKPEALTALLVSYKEEADNYPHHLLLPVDGLLMNKPCAVENVITRLQSDGAQLHDLALYTVSVRPDRTLKWPDTTEETRRLLAELQQRVWETNQPLSPLEDARAQLQLARYFISNHLRDAAYISVDNVKRLLATATRSHPGEADAIEALSKELDSVEVELHAAMPYSFSDR